MVNNIGEVKLRNNLVLAPMAGVTDIAFRIICKRFGAGLVYTEMVNANAVIRNNKATLRKMMFSEEESPITVQLFGARTDLLEKSAKKVEKMGADIVDLNLGCPDANVIKQGAGSALLRRPARIAEIIKAMKKAVSIPVTAKIRIGVKNNNIQGLKTAQLIEEAGADAIAVHGRTAEQMYSGKADWDIIRDIKKELSIPVIANGDVFTPEDAGKILKHTKADFIMIGRGAIGNPQLFSYALSYLNGNKPKLISSKEKINLFYDYIRLSEKHDSLHFATAKRHCHAFTKGIPNAVKLRDKIDRCNTLDELKTHVEQFKQDFGL